MSQSDRITLFEVFDRIMDPIVLMDFNLKIEYTNDSANNLFEKSIKRILGKNIADFLILDTILQSKINEALAAPADLPTYYSEFLITTYNQKSIMALVNLRTISIDDQTKLFFTCRDVTIEQNLHQQYRKQLEQKQILIDSLDRRVFELSFISELLSLSIKNADNESTRSLIFEKILTTFPIEHFALLTSPQFERQQDLSLTTFQSLLDKNGEIRDLFFTSIQNCFFGIKAEDLNPGRIFIFENFTATSLLFCSVHQGRDLSWNFFCFSFEKRWEKVVSQNQDFYSFVCQQSLMIIENHTLYFRSITDDKTRLYNNRYLMHRLDYEVKHLTRYGGHFSLMMIDIDHFKKLNDTYGHLSGDLAIQKVADLMRSACRTTDILARFGGEEFIAILTDTNLENALIVAERLREKIRDTLFYTDMGKEIHITASIGLCACPRHGNDPQELLKSADDALYKAKGQGRDQVCIANERA